MYVVCMVCMVNHDVIGYGAIATYAYMRVRMYGCLGAIYYSLSALLFTSRVCVRILVLISRARVRTVFLDEKVSGAQLLFTFTFIIHFQALGPHSKGVPRQSQKMSIYSKIL